MQRRHRAHPASIPDPPYPAQRDGTVLVIATIGVALAIIAEATLCFWVSAVPPTQPSLGTLIRIGQGFLFSGEWWILAFPRQALSLGAGPVGQPLGVTGCATH